MDAKLPTHKSTTHRSEQAPHCSETPSLLQHRGKPVSTRWKTPTIGAGVRENRSTGACGASVTPSRSSLAPRLLIPPTTTDATESPISRNRRRSMGDGRVPHRRRCHTSARRRPRSPHRREARIARGKSCVKSQCPTLDAVRSIRPADRGERGRRARDRTLPNTGLTRDEAADSTETDPRTVAARRRPTVAGVDLHIHVACDWNGVYRTRRPRVIGAGSPQRSRSPPFAVLRVSLRV